MKQQMTKWINAAFMVLAGVLVSFTLQAAVDGNYTGSYGEQPVTAVLETMSTTVTGMVTIGETRYLLQAEDRNGSLSGELSEMSSGETLELKLKPEGDALQMDIRPAAAAPMHLLLKRSR